MVDVDIVTSKLAELAAKIARIRGRVPSSATVLGGDPDALDIVSFNLMLAVQSCLDVASHIIADEALPPAATLAGAFQRLHDHGVISAPVAAILARAAGLRNVVAHGYAAINPEMVFRAATDGLNDLEQFAREVAVWLTTKGD